MHLVNLDGLDGSLNGDGGVSGRVVGERAMLVEEEEEEGGAYSTTDVAWVDGERGIET